MFVRGNVGTRGDDVWSFPMTRWAGGVSAAPAPSTNSCRAPLASEDGGCILAALSVLNIAFPTRDRAKRRVRVWKKDTVRSFWTTLAQLRPSKFATRQGEPT